jgi:nucleoside-diphosphate-sugar epimerase
MGTALVFAGRSFVGAAVTAALERAGARVVHTARRGGGRVCDLTDAAGVARLVAEVRPDGVVQCAGVTRGNDPREQYGLHVTATLELLAAVARHCPAASVVLFGSAAEYGPVAEADLPVRETYPARPVSFFGASKLAQTQLAAAAVAEWGLRVVTVRPFNVIGPGLPEHYFAAALAARLRGLAAASAPGPFEVANLHATRDFIDVRDVAEAVAALLAAGVAEPGVMRLFNIASGEETPLEAVARLLGRWAGGFTPAAGREMRSRGGVGRSCGDAGLLRQAVGWRPRVHWEQSLRDLWEATGERRAA